MKRRFLADAMLSKAARWLRIFGYDVEVASAREADREIAARARAEGRVLLTRDRELAGMVRKSILLSANSPEAQVRWLREHAGIRVPGEPKPVFCSVCNGRLVRAASPPKHVRFAWRCVDCGQLYWAGSHWKGIKAFVRRVSRK
jgi:uncharacterized protein with PIN domain